MPDRSTGERTTVRRRRYDHRARSGPAGGGATSRDRGGRVGGVRPERPDRDRGRARGRRGLPPPRPRGLAGSHHRSERPARPRWGRDTLDTVHVRRTGVEFDRGPFGRCNGGLARAPERRIPRPSRRNPDTRVRAFHGCRRPPTGGTIPDEVIVMLPVRYESGEHAGTQSVRTSYQHAGRMPAGAALGETVHGHLFGV